MSVGVLSKLASCLWRFSELGKHADKKHALISRSIL